MGPVRGTLLSWFANYGEIHWKEQTQFFEIGINSDYTTRYFHGIVFKQKNRFTLKKEKKKKDPHISNKSLPVQLSFVKDPYMYNNTFKRVWNLNHSEVRCIEGYLRRP